MIRACICYVIDSGYLLPALVSAVQARRGLGADAADVVIAYVGAADERCAHAQAVASQYGVQIRCIDPTVLDGMHIQYGRFFVHRMLADHYQRIVYIDGDTQIAGSLQPLVEACIPEGCFLACRDPTVLFAQLSPRWLRRVTSERAEIGFERPLGDYLNSGVLVIDRSSWPHLSEACVQLARRRQDEVRYADQDILNLAIGERCKLISNRWNFPGFLIGSQAERSVKPSIYHFMSNPRPWQEAAPPWGKAWALPYEQLLAKHPQLRPIAPAKAPLRKARYWIQQQLKIAAQYRAVGRLTEPEPDIVV